MRDGVRQKWLLRAVTDSLLVKRDNGDDEAYACLKFDFSSFPNHVASAELRLYMKEVAADASRTVMIYTRLKAYINHYSKG